MSKRLYANNASTVFASAVGPLDVTFQVQIGTGAFFPQPAAGEEFYITATNEAGVHEIMRCTARDVDTFTVVRGQQGTSQQQWLAGDRIEQRVTADDLNQFVQKGAEEATTSYTAEVITATTKFIGNKISQNASPSAPSLNLPNSPSASPDFGTSFFAMRRLFANIIFMWSGPVADIPAEFQLCDGTNGTPDLRDKFIRGAGGGTFTQPGETGGASQVTSGGGGSHTHTVGATALTINQIPAHDHWEGGYSRDDANFGSTSQKAPTEATPKASDGSTNNATIFKTEQTGGGQTHTHTLNSAASHTHSVDTIPPYYGLCFIMLRPDALGP